MRALPAAALAAALGLAPAAAQEVSVPDGFEKRTLVLGPDSGRTGIHRIEPRDDRAFRGFTLLDIERVDGPVDDPDLWLLDRLSAEAGEIAASSFFLLDPDNPEIGGAARPFPVARTLRLLGAVPESFCTGPGQAYSLPGYVRELDCTVGLGMFTVRLLLRIELAGAGWFAVRARALDSGRFRQLSAIADSVRFPGNPP